MGDIGILLDLSILFTAILFAGAISGYLSERAGIVNLGIDGMMCIGALFFGIFSSSKIGLYKLGFGAIFISIFLTMLCTSIMGIMHAFVCIKMKADHTIAGTAINLIGLAIATFANTPLATLLYPGENLTKIMCKFNSCFPLLNGTLFGSSIIMLGIIIIIAIFIWIIVNKTKIGLRYQAVGENPNAVDAQGISVYKYQWIAVLLSSMIAGLAGSLFLFKNVQFLGNVQSIGYLGLGILITGGWKIPKMFIFALIFALFNAAASTTTFTQIGLPQLVVFAIPYCITLFILLFNSKKTLAPAHSGIPFEKGTR